MDGSLSLAFSTEGWIGIQKQTNPKCRQRLKLTELSQDGRALHLPLTVKNRPPCGLRLRSCFLSCEMLVSLPIFLLG